MAKGTSGVVFGHAISHHRKQQVSKYKSGGSLITSLSIPANEKGLCKRDSKCLQGGVCLSAKV